MNSKITNIRDILYEIGYTNLSEVGDWYRTKPLYRDSNNFSSLSIHKQSGHWKDFGNETSGCLEELIYLTTGQRVSFGGKFKVEKKDKIHYCEPLTKNDIAIAKNLIPNHAYWINRNVSYGVIKHFEGGVCNVDSKMKNRYVFPIKNHKTNKMVALSGRSILKNDFIKENSIPKWKHIGKVKDTIYPLLLNKKYILESRSVLLVESIGDMLSLASAGIKNAIVCFGLSIPNEVFKFCIGVGLNNVYICFNNDEKKNGLEGAKKIRYHLSEYMGHKKVKICLPTGMNDFGDMNKEQILNWSRKNLSSSKSAADFTTV